MPRDIAAIIEYALAHGWSPARRGEPYWLKEKVDHLDLEGFFLTDVGRLADAPGPFPKKQMDPSYKEAWLKLYRGQ